VETWAPSVTLVSIAIALLALLASELMARFANRRLELG
jgi:hypothetical protein